jgi:predicted short-subunit dehydrogenase-like oxidoreductase (DUF2520 family)
MISVVIFGAGNVATHLFDVFNKANNVTVLQWFNRDLKRIEPYKSSVSITNDFSKLVEADIYILAISDDAISKFSKQLPINDKLVVHTSGTVGIHDLNKKQRRGVFYPLQTFSKEHDIDFKDVPFCIETLEKSDLKILKDLAEAIGSPYYKINTEQRQILHLSAVYVNNFTNQLYRIAHEISDVKGINFNVLKPLILETAKKIQTMSPYMAQTGPAKRNDKKTIKKHLKLIENQDHKAIYELLTNSIIKTHGRQKL